MRLPKLIITALLCSSVYSTALAAPDSAEALADKMLERLGGRTLWANLSNSINGSKQNRAQGPTVVFSTITMDFEQPRFRIDTTSENLNLVRVINGTASWRISHSGLVEDLPAERHQGDLQWYQAHIYRTIHRIAQRDPALTLKVVDSNRLEVYTEQARLLWLELDTDGEPFAFGFYQDETGSLSGPWDVVKNGIHHPRWVSSKDGKWRAAVKMLEVNVPLHASTFARPSSQANELEI